MESAGDREVVVCAEEVGRSVEELTLDTVEFCPPSASAPAGLGVVGAYDLHPDGQTRRGSLALFRVHPTRSQGLEWLWRGREGIDGVLDFKWYRLVHTHAQLSRRPSLTPQRAPGVCHSWAEAVRWARPHRPKARCRCGAWPGPWTSRRRVT
jgi:hypothetical protein